MSSAVAIAAVTAALRNLLADSIAPEPELADTIVTVQPPDQARPPSATANQLNLFLYNTTLNAAWSNTDLYDRLHRGESGTPPLALNLSYLLTPYGRDNDSQRPFSHLLLGHAMRLLHDHPVLNTTDVRAALPHMDPGAMIERVRLTLQPLTLDEITKLWTGLQSQYRLSASYQAAVVLLDSDLPVRAPLPVLRRGRDDTGIAAQPDLIAPFPLLVGIQPSDTAQPGDRVTLTGQCLAGEQVRVRIARPGVLLTFDADPGASDRRVAFIVPGDDAALRAGIHSVAVSVARNGRTHISNEIPLAIAPRITSDLPLAIARAGAATRIDVTCVPQVDPDQRACLYLGEREVPAEPFAAPTSTLRFALGDMPSGDYVLRLRVEGIDSKLLVDATARPLQFDPKARLRITP